MARSRSEVHLATGTARARRRHLPMPISVLPLILILATELHGSASGQGRTPQIELLRFLGSRPSDYLWDSPAAAGAWLQAKDGAARDRSSYASLSHAVPARPYWGQRLLLQAYVSVRGLSNGAFGALAVQVINANGRTVAFDNMRDRPITGARWTESWRWVVLDVPGPPDDGSCLADEMSLPELIHVGFLICGGRGFIAVDKVTLEVVGKDLPVTGGPPPWQSPRLI